MMTDNPDPVWLDRIVNRATRWWPYIWPTIILPFAALDGIEFITMLLLIAQTVIMFVMVGLTFAMAFGTWCGIMHRYNPDGVHGGFVKMNGAKMIPTIRWGFELAQWALEENDEN